MHGGWYTGGMGALGASSGLQGGFSTAGSLSGGVVPHSQPYHLGLGSMVSYFGSLMQSNKLNFKRISVVQKKKLLKRRQAVMPEVKNIMNIS